MKTPCPFCQATENLIRTKSEKRRLVIQQRLYGGVGTGSILLGAGLLMSPLFGWHINSALMIVLGVVVVAVALMAIKRNLRASDQLARQRYGILVAHPGDITAHLGDRGFRHHPAPYTHQHGPYGESCDTLPISFEFPLEEGVQEAVIIAPDEQTTARLNQRFRCLVAINANGVFDIGLFERCEHSSGIWWFVNNLYGNLTGLTSAISYLQARVDSYGSDASFAVALASQLQLRSDLEQAQDSLSRLQIDLAVIKLLLQRIKDSRISSPITGDVQEIVERLLALNVGYHENKALLQRATERLRVALETGVDKHKRLSPEALGFAEKSAA